MRRQSARASWIARLTAPFLVGPGDDEALTGRSRARRRSLSSRHRSVRSSDRRTIVAQPGGRVAHHDRGALLGHGGDPLAIGRRGDQTRSGRAVAELAGLASTMVAVGSRGVPGHDHEAVVVDPGRRRSDDRSRAGSRSGRTDGSTSTARMSSPTSRSPLSVAKRPPLGIPGCECVRAALGVAGRADGLDGTPLQPLAEMERVTGRHRAIDQGRGKDARQPGGDPVRVALGEGDAPSVPRHCRPSRGAWCRPRPRRARGGRPAPTSAAVPRSSTRRAPSTARGPARRPGRDGSGSRTVWPGRGWHRRGKCATPMPGLIAR